MGWRNLTLLRKGHGSATCSTTQKYKLPAASLDLWAVALRFHVRQGYLEINGVQLHSSD